MRSTSLLTLGVLGAALFTMTGAQAQNTDTDKASDTVSMNNTIMDAGIFRDSLHQVHDLFTQMRENDRLSIASADPLIQAQYQDENRRLLSRSLGTLDTISQNWKQANLPSMPGETAEATGRNNMDRFGSANATRYASESDDTAFVRNTVWDLQSDLMADKLNGRGAVITDEMMSKLDAAIKRAENPDFRVAKAIDLERLRNMQIAFSEGYQPTKTVVAGAAAPEETKTEEFHQVYLQHDNLPARNQVAQATTEETTTTTTEETPTTERSGAANENLPQTGGDPGLLYMLGSGLMGVGALLRRRRS